MNHCSSKAYRDFWDFAYHIARAELFNDKHGHENSAIYITKYMLKAVNTYCRAGAVNLGDAIKMVEKAIELTHPEPDAKPPTRSELRRFELERIVASEKCWAVGPSWLPDVETSDFYDYEDEIPF